MNEDLVIKALAALAHPVRLRVFRALVVAGDSGLTPSALSEALSVPATALSFHLKTLMHAELVTQARVSRHLEYRAAYAQMDGVLGYLTENCCAGTSCLSHRSSCCPPSLSVDASPPSP